MVGENNDEPMVRTYLAPGAYALTLTRPDTMIWILNHDVSFLLNWFKGHSLANIT